MSIVDDIQQVTAQDYEGVLQAYAADLGVMPGVLAVYAFGEVSHPGISDLDALVVVSDDIPASSLRAVLDATRSDQLRRYLFLHPPVVIPERCLLDLRNLHTLYRLRRISGRDLDIPSRSTPDGIFADLADYVDFTFAIRTALRAGAGSISLRWLLILLKSVVHSLTLAGRLLRRPVGSSPAQRVEWIRRAVLSEGQRAAPSVHVALEECLHALHEADAGIEAFLVASGTVRHSRVRECVPYADGRYYLFNMPFAPRISPNGRPRSEGMVWKIAGIDPSVEAVPAFYLAQFTAYGDHPGLFGRAHRTIFGRRTDLVANPDYRSLLTRRIDAVERAYRVLRPAGLVPTVPLGIGFRAPERIKPSRRRRWLRRLALRAVR